MGLLTRLEQWADQSREWPNKAVSRINPESVPHENSPPTWGRRTFSDRDREPRALLGDDIDAFMLASGEANEKVVKELDARHPPKAFNLERKAFLAWVTERNPKRLNRLGHELDWLRDEARKYGINPEEIRWLL